MKRRFRLTRSNDIKRVRRVGKSYAHPLVVLVVTRTPQESNNRIAIITGRSVGGAVDRNRVRRRMRAICDTLLSVMKPGFQAVLIGRAASSRATFDELTTSVKNVFQRAGMIQNLNE